MTPPRTPLAASSLPALRLLVGFALTADEAAPGRDALLAGAGARGVAPCRALWVVLGALDRAALRDVLDRLLADSLGAEAARLDGLPAPARADLWRRHRGALAGPDLAALLWQVARRDERACRDLEAEIAGACPPQRLLSPRQLAFDPVYGPGEALPASGSPQ